MNDDFFLFLNAVEEINHQISKGEAWLNLYYRFSTTLGLEKAEAIELRHHDEYSRSFIVSISLDTIQYVTNASEISRFMSPPSPVCLA